MIINKYFFLHIPKTAGTSLFTLFRTALGESNVFEVPYLDVNIGKRRAEAIKDFSLVGGHLTFEQMQTDFEQERYRIVFLRHPVDRFVSMYYFNQSRMDMGDPTVRLAKTKDFDSFLAAICETEDFEDIRNIQTRFMTGSFWTKLLPNERIALAKENLLKMDFVGITEYFADSIDLLCLDCQWLPTAEIPRENISIGRPELKKIDENLIKKIMEFSSLDMELYSYGLELYEAKKRELLRECVRRNAEEFRSSSIQSIDINDRDNEQAFEVNIQRESELQDTSSSTDVKNREFGSREIEILSVDISGLDSGSSIMKSGEKAVIRVFVKSKIVEENLTVGLCIEDEFGQMVYGTNSYHLRETILVSEGQTICVRFDLRMDLCEGVYRLVVALHTGEAHWEKCYHWKERACEFRVSGFNGAFAQGIIRLYPKQTVESEALSEPLPAEVASGIMLSVSDFLPEVRCNQQFDCQVSVINQSEYVLASYPPYPVHLSYHWINAQNGEVAVFDGERSRLIQPVAARCAGTYAITILSPEVQGEYILRITLVQEGVFWFDDLSKSSYVEEQVKVQLVE
ncbi:Wzt carbohydrate-binding domain-containing protein [Desulfosporosinus metallidurans]|uniref:ABC transporter n=1 Tax=Desulfosporosinus metallidurans TaxID=1888891 RepID=A0A1Q8QXR6_9FIRM|nr:Wzt carbohydrate-binding domain-containing protein [Desulfosporosinus metallidurans]OLN32142.1 ABC transporter [Desulfosporosinus metallidurans]